MKGKILNPLTFPGMKISEATLFQSHYKNTTLKATCAHDTESLLIWYRIPTGPILIPPRRLSIASTLVVFWNAFPIWRRMGNCIEVVSLIRLSQVPESGAGRFLLSTLANDVPQGTMLSPMLFNIPYLTLLEITEWGHQEFGLRCHQFADDTTIRSQEGNGNLEPVFGGCNEG